MNKRAIQSTQTSLQYAKEELDSALVHAAGVKDPELTKKIEGVKKDIQGVKDYITSRTDSKTAG